MAIDFDLDADLVSLVQEVSGEPDRAAAVTRALREFIDRRQGDLVLDLFPGLDWESGPDDWETLVG